MRELGARIRPPRESGGDREAHVVDGAFASKMRANRVRDPPCEERRYCVPYLTSDGRHRLVGWEDEVIVKGHASRGLTNRDGPVLGRMQVPALLRLVELGSDR